jgi:hypothetical protein
MSASKLVKTGISATQLAGASRSSGLVTLHGLRWAGRGFGLLGAAHKTLKKARLEILFGVVASVALPAWADGELDTGFGTNGVVKIDFPNSSLGYLRDAATVNDVIIAAGYRWTNGIDCPSFANPYPDLFVVKLSLSGAIIGSPSTYPQNAIECPTGLLIDPASGDIFIVGADGVARFDEKGTLLAKASPTSRCQGSGTFDSRSRYVIPCTAFAGPNPPTFKTPWPAGVSVLTLDTTTEPPTVTTVGGVVFPDSSYPMHEELLAQSIVQDTVSGDYYVGGLGGWCPQDNPDCYVARDALVVLRFDGTSGAYDTGYGSGSGAAVSAQCGSSVQAMAVDDADDLVVAGLSCIARFDSTGTLDATFGLSGVLQVGTGIADLRSDALRRIYVLEIADGLFRLNVDGTRDTSFVPNSNIGALNGVNSAWQAMKFTDAAHSSAYLLGGVDGPCGGCSQAAATTAVIAKVMLVSNVSGKGDPSSGAGGALAWWDLYGLLLIGLCQSYMRAVHGPRGKQHGAST